MQIQINPSHGLPIYRQIIRQITDAIAGGRIGPGEKLPSHRDLAAQLVVAPLTVKKAYDELEREGLLGTQRGRGTFVCSELPPRDPELSRERLHETAQELWTQASLAGVPLPELIDLLEEISRETQS